MKLEREKEWRFQFKDFEFMFFKHMCGKKSGIVESRSEEQDRKENQRNGKIGGIRSKKGDLKILKLGLLLVTGIRVCKLRLVEVNKTTQD